MIILILILAFILRLINLNQSLWLDEAVQAITAQNSISYIFQEITGDFHPPLYYFLMHFWVRIFGSSEIALRMPSVLLGAGTVFLVYRINNLSNLSSLRSLRYLSSILLATAPFHIYYSQEVRMYPLICFLATLSMFYFLKIFSKDIPSQRPTSSKFKVQNFDYLWYFIATLLMLYSDYYGFLILLAQMIFLAIRKQYKFLLICLFAYLLTYVPWVPMFIKQIQTGMLAAQILPEWSKLVNVSFLKALPLTLIKFTIGRITVFNKTFYALLSGMLIIGLGLICTRGYLKGKKLLITNYQLLITLWFFVPLLISWIASLFIPNFQPFRLLSILPAFYLIIAFGISQIRTSMICIIIAAVFLINNLITSGVYFFNPFFQREDWRGLVNYFNQMEKPKLILPSSASSWPISYYDKNKNINLITGVSGASMVNGQFEIGGKEKDEIYYIRYLVPVFDPKENILNSLSKEGYTKISEMSFNQILVWKFEMVTNH